MKWVDSCFSHSAAELLPTFDREQAILPEADLGLSTSSCACHLPPSPHCGARPAPGIFPCGQPIVLGVLRVWGNLWVLPSPSPPFQRSPDLSPSSQKCCIYVSAISSRCELEQIRSSCFPSKCPLGTPSADTVQSIMMTS